MKVVYKPDGLIDQKLMQIQLHLTNDRETPRDAKRHVQIILCVRTTDLPLHVPASPRPQGLLLDDFQNGGSLGESPFSRRSAILKIVEKKALGKRLLHLGQSGLHTHDGLNHRRVLKINTLHQSGLSTCNSVWFASTLTRASLSTDQKLKTWARKMTNKKPRK